MTSAQRAVQLPAEQYQSRPASPKPRISYWVIELTEDEASFLRYVDAIEERLGA